MRSERVAGALCTWAAYDIYRRWNAPAQVILGHVWTGTCFVHILQQHPGSSKASPRCVQASNARRSADESTVNREQPQGAFLPGLPALRQSGSGWYTTTITVSHGEQPGAVTLHDILGPPGHYDLEHVDVTDILMRLQQLQGVAGAHRGDFALDRIARAGPQDFTEVSSRNAENLCL